ncbi:protein kinase domain-containing protein [Planococcus lenghuensis]|uniref:Protein kinase domain-containing protein n=1 Tax=Planococcus lenghuensis TaxID=2213202 RepID=A0A1Q2L4S6_9BACL|nr:protein kinase [Planococcus lenghuensis]AQQ55411.1 hypothetical protein B0X71_19790 [Planococcus lenghuensis]
MQSKNKKKQGKLLNNRYILIKVIRLRGKGGVYLALDTKKMGIPKVILKEGRFQGETEPSGVTAIERLKWQESATKCLKNYQPKVLDSFTENQNYFLVYEYLDAVSIKDYIQKNRFSKEETLEIILKISEIVEEIHSQGYVLRDLSPDNVLFSSNKEIYIIDLEYSFKDSCVDNLPYFPAGTPGFCPPEKFGINVSYQPSFRDDC